MSPKKPDAQTPSDEDGGLEFFGLRTAAMRSSLYIIRQLHRDINPSLGEAPASLQAAMGALHLPSSVMSTLDQLDELDAMTRKMRLNDGEEGAGDSNPELTEKKVPPYHPRATHAILPLGCFDHQNWNDDQENPFFIKICFQRRICTDVCVWFVCFLGPVAEGTEEEEDGLVRTS